MRTNRAQASASVVCAGCLLATFVGVGCGKKDVPTPNGATSASVSASSRPVVASASASVSAAPAYSGPTGKVTGRVKLVGDLPPEVPVPGVPKCPNAKVQYGKLFRVSAERALADVVIVVTEYQGSPPLPTVPVTATIRDCAFDKQVYSLSKGQTLEVYNRDGEAYLPHLEGAAAAALLVAVPGTRTPLHPRGPGRYILQDDMKHEWLRADVVVLAYATHAVSRLDGTFAIPDIPIGKSKISAFHPAFAKPVEKQIELKDGETPDVELSLAFDKKTDFKAPPSASSTASFKGPGKPPATEPKGPPLPIVK